MEGFLPVEHDFPASPLLPTTSPQMLFSEVLCPPKQNSGGLWGCGGKVEVRNLLSMVEILLTAEKLWGTNSSVCMELQPQNLSYACHHVF